MTKNHRYSLIRPCRRFIPTCTARKSTKVHFETPNQSTIDLLVIFVSRRSPLPILKAPEESLIHSYRRFIHLVGYEMTDSRLVRVAKDSNRITWIARVHLSPSLTTRTGEQSFPESLLLNNSENRITTDKYILRFVKYIIYI